MKVRDVMRVDIVTIPHHYTYEDTAKTLRQNDLIGAPIVDDNGKLLSMITEKDMLRVLYPYAKSFYEQPEKYTNLEKREEKILEIKGDTIMKFAPIKHITTDLDTPILRIGGKMLARGIHAVPVVDERDNLLGIIFRQDIYHRIAGEYLAL